MNELTPEELREMKEILTALHAELQLHIEQSADITRPVDLGAPIGRLSRSDAMQVQQMADAGRRRSELRLKQVQNALARLSDGRYGICAKCEEPIGYKRLKAKPESPFCVQCIDQGEKHHGR